VINLDMIKASYITMGYDKNAAEVGEIIKATVKINKITNFSGYQVNIKYDPTVLQAVNPKTGVAYTNSSLPTSGELLVSEDYGPIVQGVHKISEGILNLSRSYTALEVYRASESPEETGTLAVVGFKVLQKKATTVVFEDSETMPNGITGTTLFNWYGNRIQSGYFVIQPGEINSAPIATLEHHHHHH
uniref:Cellulosomal scaffoldin adaptor protein B n=1 Tax=Acetivibrio cellulolyticus TaxID=35830 RepID=UPI0001A7C54E|nr:Chain A, Cellulosomal scaffoldin adaptor protein B [Acetivibrio cellulolyticus]3FNK_B Chain B, Cellulosomal scaffoldin adaptor protein B [Acetivibrio cellulolyticus]3FNK_C Chain C, Cellulosomal scaffoldin adaptor protein B [Acetivibrio cellulolyticus]